MSDFFKGIAPVPFKGPDSDDPLAFRFYEQGPDGPRQADARPPADGGRLLALLRLAGRRPVRRPDLRAAVVRAAAWRRRKLKAEVAFEMFEHPRRRLLHLPRPRRRPRGQEPRRDRTATCARSPTTSPAGWRRPAIGLLWGTANLFSNRRFMAGAATNPDPDVFAYAAAQVKAAMDVTHDLKGANYVLWGGREGYETLLNTDMRPGARPHGPVPVDGGRLQAQDRLSRAPS